MEFIVSVENQGRHEKKEGKEEEGKEEKEEEYGKTSWERERDKHIDGEKRGTGAGMR